MDKLDFIKLLENTTIPEGCTDTAKYLQPIANVLMEIMPPLLFRFRTINEYSLSALDKDLIFCSRAKDFNDPYDSLLTAQSLETILNTDPKSQFSLMSVFRQLLIEGYEIPEHIRDVFPSDLLKNLVASLREKSNDSTDINDMDKFTQIVNELKKRVNFFEVELRNSNSFACFSEAISSITMWGHYADYHKGFALSYDMKPLISSPSRNIMVMPVIYSSVRFDATNLLASCLGKNVGIPVKRLDMLDSIKSSLYKSPDWEYEKEWRLINTNNMLDSHPYVKYAPVGIYYGAQISDINKKILHRIAFEKGLAEFEMYIDKSSSDYKMKIRPLPFK